MFTSPHTHFIVFILSLLLEFSPLVACEEERTVILKREAMLCKHADFVAAAHDMMTVTNPDWTTLKDYTVPTTLLSLTPYPYYTFLLNGTCDEDEKGGMYLSTLSDGYKYFLKHVRFDHDGACGEIIAYLASKDLGFDLVPPCFLFTFTNDTQGLERNFLDPAGGDSLSLKGKTFTAHYFVEGKTFYTYLNEDTPIPAGAMKRIYQGNLLRGILGFRDHHLSNHMCGWNRLILIDHESCFELDSEEIQQTYFTSFLLPKAAFDYHTSFSEHHQDHDNLTLMRAYDKEGARFVMPVETEKKIVSEAFWQGLLSQLKALGLDPTCNKLKTTPWRHARDILGFLTKNANVRVTST